MTANEIVTLVLSLVALSVTTIGFFASLKFYRDGAAMQSQARDALAKIEEKAAAIQTQVGGMFDKTLDAALGRLPTVSAEEQGMIIRRTVSEGAAHQATSLGTVGEGDGPEGGVSTGSDRLATDVLKYFSFKGLRYTDVSGADARAVFNLGALHGFNLFDGVDKVTFFGYFHLLEPREIITRVRFLLNNLDLAHKRIETTPTAPQAAEVRRLLAQMTIEVLVPEEANTEGMRQHVSKLRNDIRDVPVVLNRPSDVMESVEQEYARIDV